MSRLNHIFDNYVACWFACFIPMTLIFLLLYKYVDDIKIALAIYGALSLSYTLCNLFCDWSFKHSDSEYDEYLCEEDEYE